MGFGDNKLGFNVGEEKDRLPQSRSIIFWVGRRENATEQNYFGVGEAKTKGRRKQCREEKGREKNAVKRIENVLLVFYLSSAWPCIFWFVCVFFSNFFLLDLCFGFLSIFSCQTVVLTF